MIWKIANNTVQQLKWDKCLAFNAWKNAYTYQILSQQFTLSEGNGHFIFEVYVWLELLVFP